MRKIIIVLIMSIFVLFGCNGDFILQTTNDSKANEIVDKDNISGTTYVNHTYKVGMNIPIGKYYIDLVDNKSIGFFTLSNDVAGEDVIYNNYINDSSYINVSDGQYLILVDAIARPVTELNQITNESGIRKDGIYEVGIDMPSSSYKVSVQKDRLSNVIAQYSIYSDASYKNVISSATLTGDEIANITVAEGEFLALTNAHIEMEK